jgi:uncharacterized membrane protein YpjA
MKYPATLYRLAQNVTIVRVSVAVAWLAFASLLSFFTLILSGISLLRRYTVDLALTLLAVVFGTLGFLAAGLLIRGLAESDRAAQRDRQASGRRSAHPHTADTVLNPAAR